MTGEEQGRAFAECLLSLLYGKNGVHVFGREEGFERFDGLTAKRGLRRVQIDKFCLTSEDARQRSMR